MMLSLALLPVVAVILSQTELALADCGLQRGQTSIAHVGAGRHQANVTGLWASLWNYNPLPTPPQPYGAAFFWVMLHTYGTPGGYAQVGYRKDSGDSTEYVWLEYQDGSNPYVDMFWHSTSPYWRSYKGTEPDAAHYYKIEYDVIGSDKKYTMYYEYGGTYYGYQVYMGWTPDEIKVLGETYNTGDHTPGDTGNKIQANYNKYRSSGTWYYANWQRMN